MPNISVWKTNLLRFDPSTVIFKLEFMDKDKDYVDKPFLWFKYIDDILMVWVHEREKLDCFIAYLNSIQPTIKFTSERSTTSIPFLDVNILLLISHRLFLIERKNRSRTFLSALKFL